MPTSLHVVVDVEVQDAKRLDLFDASIVSPNEEFSLTHFEHTYDLVSMSSKIEPVV